MSSLISPSGPPKIFISYREAETAAHARNLSDQLSMYFGSQAIFFDGESIAPGGDFVKAIEDAVKSCTILLAVIGRQWLICANERGRRLDDPNDFVRLEIATALRLGIRVIPVLVGGAAIPHARELPSELVPLSRRQAWELRNRYWKQDVKSLIEELKADIPPLRKDQPEDIRYGPLVIEQILEYPSNFVNTLRKPILHFPPSKIDTLRDQNQLVTIFTAPDTITSHRLNLRLLIFALISIIIGTTLSALVPGKKVGPNLPTLIILAIFVWVAYSCFVYLICKMLKGNGSFLETISIGIQIFAVVYVMSSFTALVWGILMTSRRPLASLADTPSANVYHEVFSVPLTQTPQLVPFYNLPPFENYYLLLEYPFLLYFVTQLLLLTIYVPLAVRYTHHFKGTKLAIATLILIISLAPFIQYNTLVYAVVGSPTGVPIPVPQPGPSPAPSPIDESGIVGEWRALTEVRDELSGEQFRELELIFDERGHFIATGSYIQGESPQHEVRGRYAIQGDSVTLTFDGCQHFRPSSKYQLHLAKDGLEWAPPHFRGSKEIIHFELFRHGRVGLPH